MGLRVVNTQIVHDYSTDESVLRLHLDLPLSQSETRRMRQLLDGGDFVGAFNLAESIGGSKNTEVVTSFSNAMVALHNERTVGSLR